MRFYTCEICKNIYDFDEMNICEICEKGICNNCLEYSCGYCDLCFAKINRKFDKF